MSFLLHETSAGFALFRVAGENELSLAAFTKFETTTDALAAVTALLDAKVPTQVSALLKKHAVKTLAVQDTKFAQAVAKACGVAVSTNEELFRTVRAQSDQLTGIDASVLAQMTLGLAHSLARYKLKFSPDKVDTMVIQAIALLDDLDKELNTYSMRVKEWYGWHFPELQKLIINNTTFANVVLTIGMRVNTSTCDLTAHLPADLIASVVDASMVSMGTEISTDDLSNIHQLCNEIVRIDKYRGELHTYLQNRMSAIAPNLTQLVGDMVGARLISHAGSLISLAKSPASTIQILGAEKALFRALKSKSNTPKYGLIYHATLIGSAALPLKGKCARMLATKCAIACRVDALRDETDDSGEYGLEMRAKLEERMRILEGKGSGVSKKHGSSTKKVAMRTGAPSYNTSSDAIKQTKSSPSAVSPVVLKRKAEDTISEIEVETPVKAKKAKKDKVEPSTVEKKEKEVTSEKKEKKSKKSKSATE